MHNPLTYDGSDNISPQLYFLSGIHTTNYLNSIKLISLYNGKATIYESSMTEDSSSFYFKIKVDSWTNIAIIPLLEYGSYSIEFIDD